MSPVGGNQLTLALKPFKLWTVVGGGTDLGTEEREMQNESLWKETKEKNTVHQEKEINTFKQQEISKTTAYLIKTSNTWGQKPQRKENKGKKLGQEDWTSKERHQIKAQKPEIIKKKAKQQVHSMRLKEKHPPALCALIGTVNHTSPLA